MRIALWHDLPSGGGKRALYDQVSGLLANGHSVEGWCTSTADQQFLPLGSVIVEHVEPLKTVGRGSWAVAAGKVTAGASEIVARLAAMDEHCRRCAGEIDRRGFDVVLAGSSGPLAVTTLATHLRTPSVLYLQEPYRPLYEAPTPWPAPAKGLPSSITGLRRKLLNPVQVHALRIQAREELRGVRAYDRVLANSLFSRESMIRAYGIDPKVCYLGIDTERYRDLGQPRKRLVAGIGTFFPHKRVEAVIEAVARLAPPRPAVVWIGNEARHSYLEELEALAARRQVEFIPRVAISHDDVVRILNEASVLAYAPRLEPFGYAPLEAAACGLPVVARAEGGVRETVIHGQTGLLVDDDAALAGALEELLDDPDRARSLGQAGRRWVEKAWSLEEATSRIERHLAETSCAPTKPVAPVTAEGGGAC
jgi:glycosyltransferase involved in cell wall biosynthesis